MSKWSEAEKQQMLQGLDSSGTFLWAIFDELAEQLQSKGRSKGEDYLADLLRPQDDGSLYVDHSKAWVETRQRLDDALTALTLLEIAFELQILDQAGIDLALLAGFRTLIDQSEALLRYANAYLYFGVRMFASRFFPMDWSRRPLPCNRPEVMPNTRWFPIAIPPEPELTPSIADIEAQEQSRKRENEHREDAFADFLQSQGDERFRKALMFLDGFRKIPSRLRAHQPASLARRRWRSTSCGFAVCCRLP